MWEWFKEQIYKVQSKDAEAKQVAIELSRVLLYEKFGVNTLYPDLKEKAEKLQQRMKELSKPIIIAECFRNAKKQNGYYDQGRKSPGSTITNARGLESYHQYGLAFDVIFRDFGYNPPLANWWDELGKEGEKLGLEWGGRFGDRPHFEWHPGFTWKELLPYFVE